MGCNEKVVFEPSVNNCNYKGHVHFISNDAWSSHLNINHYKVHKGGEYPSSGSFCVSPDEAIAIRDALIRIYPLEDFPVKEKFVEMTFNVPVKNASLLTQAAHGLKAEKIHG